MDRGSPGRLQLLGVRAAVTLVTLVAVLSLATGIANISVHVPTGPLAPYIPAPIQQIAGFTGTVTGFVMLFSAWGLKRGTRLGWILAVVLLPVTAIQGLIQASVYSYPLVVLSLLSVPTVLLNYRRFDRSISLSTTQLAGVVALVGTLVYGTAGTWALRDEFGEVTTPIDAFYYTVVTASTVGYGDITAATSYGRLFAVSLVVLGTTSFAVALGSVLGPAIEARFSRALGTMRDTEFELLEGHVVVLGYGDLTEPIVEELQDGVEFVIVTPDADTAQHLRNRGYDVRTGDPSDEDPLHGVAIDHAVAAIAATENDAEDAFSILTARELDPDLRIVAAASERENVEKLRRAGADVVISPAAIGGRLLVRSALGETDVESIADRLVEGEGTQ